ncbi:hypothetical protein B484DRAFT_45213 [Ochromonadaceae sp. CCMP2298]|nr:hypothetical protein B484DRAFT_45213 [Ochromonadaceae sp. CCMP2298]
MTSGAYSERLRAATAAFNATELFAATVTSMSYGGLSVDSLQDDDASAGTDSGDRGDSGTIVIVLSAVGVAVVGLALGLWLWWRKQLERSLV